MSIAGENSRAAASEHYNAAAAETMELLRDAMGGKGLVSLPLRCTMAGGGHYIDFLRENYTVEEVIERLNNFPADPSPPPAPLRAWMAMGEITRWGEGG